SKQIRDLDKNLSSVIDESAAPAQQAICGSQQRRIQVLQVAVVADVDGSSWVNHIAEQYVAVKLLAALQGSQSRGRGQRVVGQRAHILSNQAQRKLLGELIVPFGPDDVVVEDTEIGLPVNQAGKKIRVFDGQTIDGTNGRAQRDGGVVGQRGRAGTRHEIRRRPQVDLAVEAK